LADAVNETVAGNHLLEISEAARGLDPAFSGLSVPHKESLGHKREP